MNSESAQILSELLAGNERFRQGRSTAYNYSPDKIATLAVSQAPRAAVIGCIDGRTTPEIVFDQPLTKLFVSRVPGNVASDSAKWMLDIAVGELGVPLVIVMGHTECLAVGQILRGESGAGGSLRYDVARAVANAKAKGGENMFYEAVKQNALQTVETLKSESSSVRHAVQEGRLDLIAAVYDVHTGKVEIISPHKF